MLHIQPSGYKQWFVIPTNSTIQGDLIVHLYNAISSWTPMKKKDCSQINYVS